MPNIREYLKEQLKQIWNQTFDFKLTSTDIISIEPPKDLQHGDYATNIAMKLAKQAKESPLQIAETIVATFEDPLQYVAKITIAKPGFINFQLNPKWFNETLSNIINHKEKYGWNDFGSGQKVMVEFVSANPTGPLHIGHGRQAVLGDTIALLLEACGYEVTREYYFNNAGRQMNLLGQSVYARYLQLLGFEAELPEDGYEGDYITEIAKLILAKDSDKWMNIEHEKTLQHFREFASATIIETINNDLKHFRIVFDSWYNESSLYQSGAVQAIVTELQERLFAYQQDGAMWFASTLFGDEKDRVLVKSTGEPTYLTPDIAYHKIKFQRQFDKVINIHGADHHGYVPRMLAAMKALSLPDDWLQYVIHQMVSFTRGGEEIKMSTRKAQFITLRELCDEVGVDVARYFFIMRDPDSHLVFDLDLAKEQSNENPAYYVQYAHARICNIFRHAVENKVQYLGLNEDHLALLTEPEEKKLILMLAEFPNLIKQATNSLKPHMVTDYLESLAECFHQFYHDHRVITDNVELTQARLTLADATKIVLANGLKILNITAPERM
jgi:arginyl-tRNA synthetase